MNSNTLYALNNYKYELIGGLCGYAFFVVSLESEKLGKIVFRNGKFCPENIVKYMLSPFHERVLWYPILWRANWLVTTSVGVCSGYLLSNVINNFTL